MVDAPFCVQGENVNLSDWISDELLNLGLCSKCGVNHVYSHFRGEGVCESCANAPIPSKKKSIPDNIRWAVWQRDNFTCQHCGDRQYLAVDHIHPESKGGTLNMDNLQTLCRRCNTAKLDR